MKVNIILLASGSGTRFGSNKLKYYIEGYPMYMHGLLQCLKLFGMPAGEDVQEILFVSGHEELLEQVRPYGIRTIRNTSSHLGISESVKLGVQGSRGADAWMFFVADQPYFTARSMAALLSLYKSSDRRIASVQTNGKPGNPCIFSADYAEEFMKLDGDRGGRQIIRNHPDDVAYLDIKRISETEDIDHISQIQGACEKVVKMGNEMDIYACGDPVVKWDGYAALKADQMKKLIVSVVGSGGKTSLIYELGRVFRQRNRRVIITTTTHMMMPEKDFISWQDKDAIDRIKVLLEEGKAPVVGVPCGNGKITGILETDYGFLTECAEILLVEADGSRRRPFKVPAAHEPVIFPGTDITVGVIGCDCLEQRIADVSQRPDHTAEFLGKDAEDLVALEDIVYVAGSPEGLFKNAQGRRILFLNKLKNMEQAVYMYKCIEKNTHLGFEDIFLGRMGVVRD